jgi:hypothetical protein
VTTGERLISDRQPEHTHEGNVGTAMARKAVGEMKVMMEQLGATPSAAIGAISAHVTNQTLMALPRRSTVTRVLQIHRKKALNSDLAPVPRDLNFQIPDSFADVVLFDSGPGDDRMIIMGCDELLDGLGRSDIWLADGTFKVVPGLFFSCIPYTSTSPLV